MKILATSDWHLDAMTAGVSRAPELDAYVDAVVDRCVDQQIDVVLVGGDYYDPGSLRESQHAARLFRYAEKIQRVVSCSVWIAGNHDVVGEGSVLSPLAVASRWWRDDMGPEVAERPRLVDAFHGEPSVAVLALPFVAETPTVSMVALMEKAVADARAAKARGDRLVVLGHFTIPGVTVGSEEEMVRGRDLLFPAQLVRSLEPDLVINGHYHAQQTVEYEGVTIHIPGAPLRMTFGERDDGDRGWLEIALR